MEKKIEQYLPFYIDAIEVQCPKQIGWKHSQKRHPLTLSFLYEHRDKKLIPILRPLSSMTEEEGCKIFKDWNSDSPNSRDVIMNHKENELRFSPDETLILLELGMDIFGLKEKGLCLYPEEL